MQVLFEVAVLSPASAIALAPFYRGLGEGRSRQLRTPLARAVPPAGHSVSPAGVIGIISDQLNLGPWVSGDTSDRIKFGSRENVKSIYTGVPSDQD